MVYPAIEIDLAKIRHNTRVIVKLCKEYGIDLVGVTKVSNGAVEIAQAMIEGGVSLIGDSRLRNLENYQGLPIKKMLLRLPMISETEEVVKLCHVSLNSEIETIKALSVESQKANKTHEVILMVDVGDLREGIFDEEEIMETVGGILKLKAIKLVGLGTNLTCFGAIIPSEKNLGRLVSIRDNINHKFGIDLNIISGGNSGSLCLIQNGKMPDGINQLRLGTSLILGLVEVTWTRIPDTHIDAFKLIAEIVEIKEKPSKPIGEIAMDAFRNVPSFKDRGQMKRAICAVGRQDCEPDFMVAEDKDIEILGSSSDHLILDISHCKEDYRIGDKLTFVLDYVAILRCMTSRHIRKIYRNIDGRR